LKRGASKESPNSEIGRLLVCLGDFLSLPCGEQMRQNPPRVKYWEIIADKLNSLNEAQL